MSSSSRSDGACFDWVNAWERSDKIQLNSKKPSLPLDFIGVRSGFADRGSWRLATDGYLLISHHAARQKDKSRHGRSESPQCGLLT